MTPLSTMAPSTDPALDAFLASYYALRPVNATFTGMHMHDTQLPDWSAIGVEASLGEMQQLRRQLAHGVSAGDVGTLDSRVLARRDWHAIDRALADSFLEIQIAELEGHHFQRGNPSLVTGEAAFAIISLMIRDFAPADARAHALSARLKALPFFLSSATDVLREGPVPGAWVEKARKECDGVRALLLEGVELWGAEHVRGRSIDGRTEALAAVEAFAEAITTLTRDASPARACGEEFLALLVRRGHWVDRTLDDVLREVRARYAEARTKLDEMAIRVDPRGMPGVAEQLAAAHPLPDEYYVAFEGTWTACHELAVDRRLVSWPHFPIHYVPIPRWTRVAAPSLYYLYYRSPAPLELPELHEYVVPPIDTLDGEALEQHLRAWNDSVIKLNHVVHHGALGHHVQNWYAAHSRSRIGQIAATDCASRIGMFLGGTMAEGWACYATDLMQECGFLTPAEEVSEQHTQVRMLARAIVDIEFHTGRRSFEEAVALYRDEVGMSPAAALGEATKNSMFPGTAMMYWLGTSQIHALRGAMAERQGDRFSLQSFHDDFLSFGSMPVALIARAMLASADEQTNF